MPLNAKSRWEQVRAGRVRILWLVLGALLLVSALPIGLYTWNPSSSSCANHSPEFGSWVYLLGSLQRQVNLAPRRFLGLLREHMHDDNPLP